MLAARVYLRTFGVLLLSLGVLGFIFPAILSIIGSDLMHNVARLLIGGTAIYFGWYLSYKRNVQLTKIFGLVYTGLFIIGLAMATPVLGVQFTFAEDLLHLVIGVVGLAVGFGEKARTDDVDWHKNLRIGR